MPCCREVAVSVLMPPKVAVVLESEAPRCANAVVALCESSELAGRAARRAERANTMMREEKCSLLKILIQREEQWVRTRELK